MKKALLYKKFSEGSGRVCYSIVVKKFGDIENVINYKMTDDLGNELSFTRIRSIYKLERGYVFIAEYWPSDKVKKERKIHVKKIATTEFFPAVKGMTKVFDSNRLDVLYINNSVRFINGERDIYVPKHGIGEYVFEGNKETIFVKDGYARIVKKGSTEEYKLKRNWKFLNALQERLGEKLKFDWDGFLGFQGNDTYGVVYCTGKVYLGTSNSYVLKRLGFEAEKFKGYLDKSFVPRSFELHEPKRTGIEKIDEVIQYFSLAERTWDNFWLLSPKRLGMPALWYSEKTGYFYEAK